MRKFDDLETAAGLCAAHQILAEYAVELANRKLKWWQIGRSRVLQMAALAEYSDRLKRATHRAVQP